LIKQLRKNLLSMVFNRKLKNDQILAIDSRLMGPIYEDIHKSVTQEVLEKGDFSEDTVAISLAKSYDPENILSIIKRAKAQSVSAKNYEDTVEKLTSMIFRSSINHELMKLTTVGNDMSNEKLLAELNRVAAMRPFKDDSSLEILVKKYMHEIVAGDDIIKFDGFLGRVCGGFTRGEMSVWGGRPGAGKTNTVLNVADYIATNYPAYKILILSREMTNTQLLKRLLLINSAGAITYDDLRAGEPLKGKKKKLALELMDNMSDKYKNLTVLDNVATLDEGVTAILKHQPDIVIDDFIGIIEDEELGGDKIRHLINKTLKRYKWLAKKLNAHIMNISQLNRNIEQRLEPNPIMSDFNESGMIEQLCELVIVATRAGSDKLAYHVLKARHGKPQTAKVNYDPSWCKIYIGD